MEALSRSAVPVARSLSIVVLALGGTGCVERLLQVRSDPPGASVHLNGEDAGTTPLERPFTFYGTYDVTLRSEDHFSERRLVVLEPPWYERFPLDFFSEFIVPWTIRDVHVVDAKLAPAPARITEEKQADLSRRASELGRELRENGDPLQHVPQPH
jgi:hypothetical protein